MLANARPFTYIVCSFSSITSKRSTKKFQTEIDEILKRTQTKSEILYGIQPILGALHRRQRTIVQLMIKSELLDLSRAEISLQNAWIANIIDLANTHCVPIKGVSIDFLSKITNGRSHQNVALECSHLPFNPFSKLFISNLMHFINCSFQRSSFTCCGSSGIILLLDQIQDVMNLGSILRSAVFFGLPTVLISSNSALPSPLISKLSAGAMESIRFHRVPDIKSTLKELSSSGFCIVGTAGRKSDVFADSDFRPASDLSSITPEMVGLSESAPPKPLLLALGSEVRGLSPSVLSACNLVIRIPGIIETSHEPLSLGQDQSPLPTSLNVAAATGILLYKLKSLRDPAILVK